MTPYFLIAVSGLATGVLLWSCLQPRARQFSASRRAGKWIQKLGEAKATEAVLEAHAQQVEALDDDQRKQAETLMADPRALARYLVRVGEGK